VPAEQFFRVFYILPLIVIKCIVLLLMMAGAALVRGLFFARGETQAAGARWRHGWESIWTSRPQRYLDGDVFAYGCIGILVLVANGFYFIQKSLIHVIHPFAWDDAFVAADRFLHFGHSPDEFGRVT